MKLRVMGRFEECAAFAAIIAQNVPARYLRSILQPYPLNVLPEKKRR